MNKRFMSLLLVLVMVFSLLPISAMASVYPITGDDPETALKVVFKNGSAELDTQYLQRSNSELHDPGVPQTSGNEMFRGWYLDSDFHGEKMTIKNLNDYVHENYYRLKTEGTLYVYAKVVNTYSVTYVAYEKINDSDKQIVQQVDTVEVPEGQATANYTVDAEYSPLEANQDFRGWVDQDDQHLYQVGDPLSVGSNKTMVARVVDGYWITFDENDRKADKEGNPLNTDLPENDIHASYQKPVHVANDEGKNLADIKVEATGYEFLGWFTARVGGTKVTSYSRDELRNDVTLYAHWKKVDTAKYRVIIWKQNLDGETYDYVETIPLSGNTFSTINTVTQQGTGDNAYARVNGVNKQYTGFHLKEFDQNVTIKPQGNSVVNVYYDRNEYTLTFKDAISERTITVDRDFHLYTDSYELREFKAGTYPASTFEGLLDKEGLSYYRALWNENTFYYNFYKSNGTEDYESASIRTTTSDKTITALYGQPIGDNFPITNDGARWSPQSSSIYNYVLVYIPYMREENTTFTKDTKNYTLRHMHYYVEVLPGYNGTDTVSYGNKTFKQYGKTIDAKYAAITKEEDFIKLNGFQRYGSEPDFGNGNFISLNDNITEVNFYYTRESYNIQFMDGSYIAERSDGNEYLTGYDQGALTPPASIKNTGILYETDLTSYNKDGANYFVPQAHEGFTFAGWFKDKDCTQPYEFTTMPVDGITVYAKWILDKYSVSVNLNAPEAEVTYSGGKNFTPNYHEAITLPTPSRSGYAFVGWYADEDFTIPFINGTKIDDETDGLNTGFTEGGVKGKLTIYAKWRQVLDGDGFIKVEYEAQYGTKPTDNNQYADHARSSVQSAPTGVPEGIFFRHWVVLAKDGNETNLQYYPGDELNVLEQYAKKVGNSYTMTLRAVYRNPAVDDTFLKYDANGGAFVAGTAEQINNLRINAEVTLYGQDKLENGELLLGWNHVKADADAGTVEFQPGQTVGVDDLTDASNTLYAVWDQTDNHNYVIDFNGKMTIATSATAKKDATDKNGAFNVAGGLGTYQLKNTEDTFANGANLAFSGVDTALINGVPVGSPNGTTASWEKYTVIPANNVYFDDSLVGKSMTAGDGSGYNAEVSKYNDAASGQEKTNIEITFTGDGIDVYCTTPNANGWIQATVTKDNGDVVKQPYTNTRYVGGGELHNIPVISFRDLGTGTHTLVITTLTGANYKLDGIRVYNGMQDANETDKATVDTAYAAAKEQNLALMSVRSYLLSKSEFEKVTEKGVDENATVTGAVFIDTNKATTSVADYKAAGPKNEAYLASGQGVAFQIKGWATFKDTNKVMVGLSVPAGGTATVAASGRTGNNKIQLNAETHMFYEIKPDNDGNVYIYNTGKDMVSVTDLKITGTKQYAAPATFTLGAPITPESEGGALTVSPKLLMRYVQDFDPEAVIEDPQVIDEPQTPETPDDGDKPGWNDNSYNPMTILKNLFQNLLNSLSSLFGGLGKW